MKLMLKTVIIIVLIALIAMISAFALPWACIGCGMLLSPDPPKPEITYGEFPFELIYEVDGEVITVNDTYVCEFDGIGADEGRGKYREWKGYIKGTGKECITLFENKDLALICYVGSPEYYMSDPDYLSNESYTPHVIRTLKHDGWTQMGGSEQEIEKFMKQYKVKLISWKLSDPIENTYK